MTCPAGQPDLPETARYQVANASLRPIDLQRVFFQADLPGDIECPGRQVGNPGQDLETAQLRTRGPQGQLGPCEAPLVSGDDPGHVEPVVAEQSRGLLDSHAIRVRADRGGHIEGPGRQSAQIREIMQDRDIRPNGAERDR